MKLLNWHNFGVLVLFLGLSWMFLPHATHVAIIDDEESEEHIIHVIEGGIAALAGVGLIEFENRRLKRRKR
jgi:nitrate reductase gamma subunit